MSPLLITSFVIFFVSLFLLIFFSIYIKSKVVSVEKDTIFYDSYLLNIRLYICEKYNLVKHNVLIFIKFLILTVQIFWFLSFLLLLNTGLTAYLEGAANLFLSFREKLLLVFTFFYVFYPFNVIVLILLLNLFINKIISACLYFRYKNTISFTLLDRLIFAYTYHSRLYEYSKESEKNKKKIKVLFRFRLFSFILIIIIWLEYIIFK